MRILAILLLSCAACFGQSPWGFGSAVVQGNAAALTPAVSFESETLTYATNIAANSGTISSGDLTAVDTFVKAAKANGYWTNLLDASPMAGDQTNAAVVKIVAYPGFSSKLTPSANMSSAYYVKAYGWTNAANGSQRWLAPGFNLDQITNSTAGVGFYVTSKGRVGGDGSGSLYGYWPAGPPYFLLYNLYLPDAPQSGSFNINAYWGTNSEMGGRFTVAGIHRWCGINQDDATTKSIYLGPDAALTSTGKGFSGTGNSNPVRMMTGQGAGDNFVGSVGFYAMHKNMTQTSIDRLVNDVSTLMIALGREPAKTKPLWIVPVTGQSLATATGSTTALSTNYPPFDDYTTAGVFASSPKLNVGLIQARETYGTETIVSAWMYQAQAMGISNSVALYSSVNAVGGAPYSNYLNIGTAAFNDNLALMTNGTRYASNLYSAAVVPAVMSIHGETDRSNSFYQSDLMQWVRDFGTNAARITGQTNSLKMFHSQISCQDSVANSQSDIDMLAEQEKGSRSNLVVCAKYSLPYASYGTPHLNSAGYQVLAEYYGKAFYREFYGGGWEPLRPVDVQRSGAVITVTFTNTVGGLVFDATHIPSMTNHVAAANYGFTYTDSSSPPAISSVVISGASSNQVTITLASTPTGSNKILRYGIWDSAASGDLGGTTNILHGNLRNQDQTTGYLSSSNLWDWCVHFSKSVP